MRHNAQPRANTFCCVAVQFMLTMFPLDMIEEYANKNGWIIHRIERTITASKTSRRKQEEWMVCNYEGVQGKQGVLFE